ncbi:MAG: hypothetical protein KatS3mg053_0819 [Candidatus Roseilinea sp.]|jgi:DNA-binding FrmR family transcriptional regulator|nr:MAG: hypothetical protein KatS3mg053_0819 [Candidatus Roseilinea sp.]
MAGETTKKDLLTRLKTIEGHVRGVQRMVEDGAYCIDVIHQVKAIQQALERFNATLLSEHLNTCVTTAIRSDDPRERERVVSELLHVFGAAGGVRSAPRTPARAPRKRSGRR